MILIATREANGFVYNFQVADMIDEQQNEPRIYPHAVFLTAPGMQRDQPFIDTVRIGKIGAGKKFHKSAPFARANARATAAASGAFQRAAT